MNLWFFACIAHTFHTLPILIIRTLSTRLQRISKVICKSAIINKNVWTV